MCHIMTVIRVLVVYIVTARSPAVIVAVVGVIYQMRKA